MSKFSERGVIHIVSLLILLVGIAGGLYLVQHPQIFKPKATNDGTRIEFVNDQGEAISSTTGQNVKLKITYVAPSPTPIPATSTPTPAVITSASYIRVFITNGTNAGSNNGYQASEGQPFTGNLGGLSGADNKCQERAAAANLGGTWKAWLSDSNTSAASRLNHSSIPYKLLNGRTIANHWEDLIDGTLQHAITVNEFGFNNQGNPVWTGTAVNGNTSSSFASSIYTPNCQNWTRTVQLSPPSHTHAVGESLEGVTGAAAYRNHNWTDSYTQECTENVALYCIDQVPTSGSATVPAPIPIPASADYRRVFNTAFDWQPQEPLPGVYNGYEFGNLSSADAKCQERAGIANLGGSWKAWLSDSNTPAASRLEHSAVPYKRAIDGVTIADNWEDLIDGSIDAPILTLDPFLNQEVLECPECNIGVWTGTLSNGSSAQNNCLGWASISSPSNPSRGQTGRLKSTDGEWTNVTNYGSNECILNLGLSLICFEQSGSNVQGISTAYAQSQSFPTQFRVSNSEAGLENATEQNFDTNGKIISWNLPSGSGTKTVYAQFKVDGLWQNILSASITVNLPIPVEQEASFTLQTERPSYAEGTVFPTQVIVRSDNVASNLFVAKLNFDRSILAVDRIETDNTFIQNWIEQFHDNNTGIISLSGGVPDPGFQSSSNASSVMATIYFRALRGGSTDISFDDDSAIYSNVGNTNILASKTGITGLTITGELQSPVPSPSVNPSPSPSTNPSPNPSPGCIFNGIPVLGALCPSSGPAGSGDGNGDNIVDLTDLSILLSDFNKTNNFKVGIDMNTDSSINTFDAALLRNKLIESGVIRRNNN